MPYEYIWVPPELFFTHNGVNVFYTYKDDEIEQGVRSSVFTLDAVGGNDLHFDVESLAVPSKEGLDAHPPYINSQAPRDEALHEAWRQWHDHGEAAAMKAVIIEALDAGLLDEFMPEDPESNQLPGDAE